MPESHNGHRPVWPEGNVHAVGLGPRVMAWVDVVTRHLFPITGVGCSIKLSREIDDSLERVADRLRRRHR